MPVDTQMYNNLNTNAQANNPLNEAIKIMTMKQMMNGGNYGNSQPLNLLGAGQPYNGGAGQ